MASNKKRKGAKLLAKKARAGYWFLLPIILGLIFIFLPALIDSIVYSFHTVTIEFAGLKKEWVGISNFKTAFIGDSEFTTILMSALKGIFLDSTVIILFSFFMSNVLNQKFAGRGLVRMVFFLPVVLAVGIVADMEAANEMYNSMSLVEEEAVAGGFDQIGMAAMFSIGNLIARMGLPPQLVTIVQSILTGMYDILNSSGVQILIFLSALQSINPSVFEAAKVEGATKWEEFWKITFPMLTPSLLVCTVYTIISTFTNPIYGVMNFIEDKAFSNAQLGYASALSWIYFIIIIVVLGVVSAIISKRVTYQD